MSSSSVPGTNVPPISFPGISSGIDYNSIIQKLTALTLAPEVGLNQQIATLNAANAELIKINNLFASVQSAIGALSNPSLFSSFDATSSNLSVATAQGISGAAATAGTYTIQSSQVATSSSVYSSPTAGHKMTDLIASGIYAGQAADSVPLANSYAAITPSNGSNSQGSITVDGVQVTYNVNNDSLKTILAKIQTAVQASYDPSFTIAEGGPTGDTIVVNGSKPITLGSGGDSGNLLQVLKLDQAQVNNSGPGPYTVTGTSGVGGINQAQSFSSTNGAGFVTPVTSGTITINGVSITVDANGDNLASVLAKINASAAGVNATYNAASNKITLTSKTTGAQSIVVGASGGPGQSNFLQAAGLTSGAGATSTIGQQAVVTVQNPDGSTQTVYSNTNTVTSAIPGVQLNLISNSQPGIPYSISVSQNSSNLTNAINGLVSSYNAAITEINNATQPPVITQAAFGSLPTGPTTPLGAGILYGNSNVRDLKNQLTNMVSGFFGNTNTYDSLASVGLTLSGSFTTLTTGNNGQNNGGTNAPGGTPNAPVQQTTYQGTDGTFQPLNAAKFAAALQANPNAVQALFQGAGSLTERVGSFLTGATGFPTMLSSGTIGNIPSVSLIQNFENQNTNVLQSMQAQLKQITANANMQADALRKEFVSTESQLAGFQALQSQLAGFFKSSGG